MEKTTKKVAEETKTQNKVSTVKLPELIELLQIKIKELE